MKTLFRKSLLAVLLTLATSAFAQADKSLVGTWEGWLVQGDGSQQSQRQQRISELVIFVWIRIRSH